MHGRRRIPVVDSVVIVKDRLPSRYYNMVGANALHYYVAYPRQNNLVRVIFFRLPLELELPVEDYEKKLEIQVERYLMAQHDTMSDEAKMKFVASLQVHGGKIGSCNRTNDERCEFGYVQLRVRTQVTSDGMSATDFSDVIEAISRERNRSTR